jgi:hypothetical protein
VECGRLRFVGRKGRAHTRAQASTVCVTLVDTRKERNEKQEREMYTEIVRRWRGKDMGYDGYWGILVLYDDSDSHDGRLMG